MPDLPDDSRQNPKSGTKASTRRKERPTAKQETVHDQVMKEISRNPRWSMSKESGTGFVIGGMRPSKVKANDKNKS
jgi:hypothetical protein